MAERLLFTGARIEPVPGGSPAEAMRVADGRVVAVGARAELRHPQDMEIDLGGGVVRPGFHDAHTHLSAGAVDALARIDLRTARDAADAAQRAAAHAASLPPGTWVRGFGWDHTRWPGAPWPTREALDAALPDRPAFLVRVDGHAAWVNGAGLRALGAEGTGILLEEAMEEARGRIPADAGALRRAAVREALRLAASLGVVAVEDVAEGWAPELYGELRDDGLLTARIGIWLPADLEEERAAALRRAHPPDHPWIAVTTRKLFLDGTLGSRTAALSSAYADAPETRGELRFGEGELEQSVRAFEDAGWSVALHAIGDAAVDQAVRVLGRTRRPGRHRIEHLQVVGGDALARLARLGVGASVQPVHFSEDASWIAARLGAREALVYPWRSLQEAGVPLGFGTDWPIAPLDPRLGLEAARRREDEGMSEEAAWTAYTRGAAAVSGRDAPRGTLLPGAFADFVVWDPAARCVRATWVGGRQVF
ncbi:MAG TPA: amidohydrolase [Candidatus Polarisedimenticolaceae bacterium]|nr:amidohydrolase [Candidatus Polarisedimenticolaceae bacterium]